MGNTLLEATDKYPLKQFDSWTEQKPELSGGKLLFQSKIFHTMSFNLKNQNSSIVMKVYLKESDFDSRNSDAYREQFEYLRRVFNPVRYPNVLPFITLMNFEPHASNLSSSSQQSQSLNFVVVARQQMYQTLADRFHYKPSLSDLDKQWILFQTLVALHCVHKSENLFHGGLRASNLLLTTSNHVFLSDFANYKPIFINEASQIMNLRFFFKAHENNSTLAPEKFQNTQQQPIISLEKINPQLLATLQAMDIFSLGCVISDLYLEGETPLFTYEQVQKFKTQNYDPLPIIKKIKNQKIRELVAAIIMQPNEANRFTISQVLEYFAKEVVEDSKEMMFIYHLDIAIQSNLLSKADFRVGFMREMLPLIHSECIRVENTETLPSLLEDAFKYSMPLCLQRVDFKQRFRDSVLNLKFKLWEILGLEMPAYLSAIAAPAGTTTTTAAAHKKPFEHTYNLKIKELRTCQELFNDYMKKQEEQNQQQPATEQNVNNGNDKSKKQQQYTKKVSASASKLRLIVMLLCTNLRTVQYASTKLVGLELLVHLSQYMTDFDVLHTVLPFVCDALEDFELQVAEYAFEAMCTLIERLEDPFESLNDTNLYKVFVWPNFQKCAKNLEIRRAFVLRGIDFARACIKLADIAQAKHRRLQDDFFNQSISDTLHRTMSIIRPAADESNNLERMKREVVDVIKEIFRSCLSDCPADISNLAITQLAKLLEFLQLDSEKQMYLNLFISCLNRADRKLSCLESMYSIFQQIQGSELKMFVVLCLKDCLNDQNEIVSFTALNCSWRLVEKGMLDKTKVYEFLEQIAPLMLHPHNWIRREAITFVRTVIATSHPIQVFLEIQPKIVQYLSVDVAIITPEILDLILPPRLDKKSIDFKNRRCFLNSATTAAASGGFFDPETSRYLELFQKNYLTRSKSSKDQVKILKEEELKNFQSKLDSITLRGLYKQNFSKRLAEFLVAGYKHNMMMLLNLVSDRSRFYGQMSSGGQSAIQEEKNHERAIQEYFRDHKIFFENGTFTVEVNNEVQKFLQQMYTQLSLYYDECMKKFGLYANHHHKNFANSELNVSEFLLKLEQVEVQPEIDVGKPFFSDPAGVSGYANSNMTTSMQTSMQLTQSAMQSNGNSGQASSLSGSSSSGGGGSGSGNGSGAGSANSLRVWHPQGRLVTTIHEHTDQVSSLESVHNNRHFISASYDGTLRIFDAAALEADFTSDSVAQIVCSDEKNDVNSTKRNHKIKVIRMIPDSSSVLVGTEKGSIHLFNIEKCTDMKIAPSDRVRNLQTIYGQGEVRCLESFRSDTDKCFLFATSKGEVGVRDIRSKSVALANNIGKERGLISSMILAPSFNSMTTSSAVIGTLNGYCLMYDLRCNLLSKNYQLLNHQEEPLPIMSLSCYHRFAHIDLLENQQELLAVSFASDNHEVAMFNMGQSVDNMNPSVYMLSTENYNPTFTPPMLKSLSKQENFKNCNKNILKDMLDYDFIPHFADQVDVLSYLNDPLMTSQSMTKLKWLEHSNNCYANMQRIYECKNYVSKILCLPSHSVANIPKTAQNSIITCGNDRNIRMWPMVNDPPSKSNYQIDTQIKGFHISNVDEQQRNFSQKKVANVLVLHEYSRSNFQSSGVYALNAKKKSTLEELNYQTFTPSDKRAAHYDTITDMIYLERDNGALLVSASRDKTIKVWK